MATDTPTISIGNAPDGDFTDHLDLITNVIEAFGLRGIFTLHVHDQITWRGNNVIAVSRRDGDKSLVIKLKPGDNNTSRKCFLTCSQDVNLELLEAYLTGLERWDGMPSKLPALVGAAKQAARADAPRATDPAVDKLYLLRRRAAAYTAGLTRVTEMRTNAELALKEAEQLEKEAQELEESLQLDHTGRNAAGALQAIDDLLKIDKPVG